MSRLADRLESVTRLGSLLAGALTAHTVYNTRMIRRPMAQPPDVAELVSVCVPARNEARNIERCLQGVLATQHVDNLQLLVLDDGSTDSTAAIARDNLRDVLAGNVIAGAALGRGWLGKPHACEQLRGCATGSVLVFVDADVVLETHAVAAAVELLRRFDLAMVSPYPRQVAITPTERLVQPLLQWLWLTFLPLRLAEGTRPVSMTAANGQFMAIDARALEQIGGFAAVRDRVLDDVELARAFKRAGRRAIVADGTGLATCRMYRSWPELRDGYTKNLWAGTGSPGAAVGIGALLALAYVVPPTAAAGGLILGRKKLALVGALGTLAGVCGRVMSARATGGSRSDALAHPVSVGVLLLLLARSWREKRRGAITWKGRRVDG